MKTLSLGLAAGLLAVTSSAFAGLVELQGHIGNTIESPGNLTAAIWEQEIQIGSTDTDQANLLWGNGVATGLSFNYDSLSGMLDYTVGSSTLSENIGANLLISQIQVWMRGGAGADNYIALDLGALGSFTDGAGETSNSFIAGASSASGTVTFGWENGATFRGSQQNFALKLTTTPIPEPSVALAGLTVLALCGVMLRRRR